MIENNLLKTNFLGKDGFRWWIGQVAPEDAQGDQINQIGNTWGSRVKVRIYGYHPPNETELKNIDLPWAQVLLSPQGGSGKANRARSLRISPGDIVMGFFLDGDDAQLPVILGMFANTPDYYGGTSEYTSPFEPFTGYTSKIKPNPDFIAKNEGGDSNQSSQKSPRFVTKEIIEDLNEKLEKGETQLKQLVDSGELQQSIQNASEELKNVINSGKAQTGLSDTQEIVEGLKRKYGFPEVQAFKDIGKEVIFGSGTEGSNNNTKVTNSLKSKLKNSLGDIKNAVPKDKFKELANASKSIVASSTPIITDMVNTAVDEMAPAFNGGLRNIYDKKFGEVMGKTGNLALAKKAATAVQVAEIPNVLNVQNALPCVVKNITDKLSGDVFNLLTQFTDNVENFTDCIGDQFIGAIFNDVIKGINNELGDALKGVSNIFDGDIEGILRGKAEGILGIASIFDDCDIPSADLGSKTNKWVIGLGPASVGLENIAGKILDIANAAQELKEAAASPGGVIGNLGLFDFMRPDVSSPGFSSTLSDCYTGPPLNCSGIKVNLFGGGGQGAQVNPILGALVSDTFAVQTASLIGMRVKNAGSGYQSPPFVEITDTCRKGYGASARAVIDYDPNSPTYQQVTDVYVVSAGENYPVIEPDEDDNSGGQYPVDHVVVVNPGENYKQEDIVIDNKGNIYEKFLDERGRILNVIPPNPSTNNVKTFSTLPELSVLSTTGRGAIIKGQLLPRPEYQGEIKQVIDCISPRDAGIVGFVNGEPYYGAFHVMSNGTKMTGAKHSDSDMIIYDTPQESRTSRGMMSMSTSYTTVSSAPVQNVSDTITTSQPDTSSTTTAPQLDIPDQTPTQQPSQPTYTPPPSSPPSGGGSSGSGGGSSGGGGYGGGY
tara:strand:- start:861 stop:3515 length:2655 start_codon:yes stop_codon:yes gene_type:complete